MQNLISDVETKILFPSYHNKNIGEAELQNNNVIKAGNDWRNGWNEVRRILLDNEK